MLPVDPFQSVSPLRRSTDVTGLRETPASFLAFPSLVVSHTTATHPPSHSLCLPPTRSLCQPTMRPLTPSQSVSYPATHLPNPYGHLVSSQLSSHIVTYPKYILTQNISHLTSHTVIQSVTSVTHLVRNTIHTRLESTSQSLTPTLSQSGNQPLINLPIPACHSLTHPVSQSPIQLFT